MLEARTRTAVEQEPASQRPRQDHRAGHGHKQTMTLLTSQGPDLGPRLAVGADALDGDPHAAAVRAEE